MLAYTNGSGYLLTLKRPGNVLASCLVEEGISFGLLGTVVRVSLK